MKQIWRPKQYHSKNAYVIFNLCKLIFLQLCRFFHCMSKALGKVYSLWSIDRSLVVKSCSNYLKVSIYFSVLAVYWKSSIIQPWLVKRGSRNSVIPKVCSADHWYGGPRDWLKWSANPNTNQYFVLRWPQNYPNWSSHRKSLATMDVTELNTKGCQLATKHDPPRSFCLVSEGDF